MTSSFWIIPLQLSQQKCFITSIGIPIMQIRHPRLEPSQNLKKCHPTSIGIPTMKIRWSRDRLISIMGFPILVRWHLYFKMNPSQWHTWPRTPHASPPFLPGQITADNLCLACSTNIDGYTVPVRCLLEWQWDMRHGLRHTISWENYVLCQKHDSWCSGSLRRQVINSHDFVG